MLFVPERHSQFFFDSSSVVITPTSIEFSLSHDAYQAYDFKEVILHIRNANETAPIYEQELYPLVTGTRIRINHEIIKPRPDWVSYDIVSLYPEATDINMRYTILYGVPGTHFGYFGSYMLKGERQYLGARCLLYDTSFEYLSENAK